MAKERDQLPDDALLTVADGLDAVVVSANEVLIQFGTRSSLSELLRDPELRGFLGPLIARLNGTPATLDNLLAEMAPEHRGDAGALLADLIESGVIADVRRSAVDQYVRYAQGDDSRFAARSIGIIGAGPLGARVAIAMARHGIGRIVLLDDRHIDRMGEMTLPFAAPIRDGSRADALLADHLRDLGFTAETVDGDLDSAGISTLLSRCDLALVMFEQPNLTVTHLMNRLGLRADRIWIHASIDGHTGLVGPMFVPGHTACYNCYRTLADASTPSPEMARIYRRHLLRRGNGTFFVGLPVYADVVASHVTLAAVQFLLHDTSFLLGRVMAIDFQRLQIDTEDVLKLPRCPVCGRVRSAYRPTIPVEITSAT